MSFNPIYLLILLPGVLAMWAQARVRRVYEKNLTDHNRTGTTGGEAARHLLERHGLHEVKIESIEGRLTDHYDPEKNVLRLSEEVANSRSITALGIVAHEVGHAAQDAEGYRFMRLRTFLAQRIGPVTQWSSIAFIGGWIFGIPVLMVLSGVIMAAMVIFSLVTLPVERNASDRALKSLEQTGLAMGEEREGVRHVLRAASFTYMAGMAQRFGKFLFFVVLIAMMKGLVRPS